MLKAFSQIDLFGKAVLFNYKGNSTSKSKVGAICTILLFGFIIWLMVYFGQALFNKSNPQATTFESYNENPSATALTTDSFVFAIGLANSISYANFINESLYSVYASTYKSVRTPQADGSVDITYEQIPLEIVSCESEYFGNLADQFAYLTLDQLYCIKPNQSALTGGFPVLEGSFESPTYQSVYIEFTQCDNTTSSCGTPAEIDKALRGAYMSLVYSNIAVDLTNSKAPLKQFRDSYYTTVDNHYYKEITMYIEQLEINTDDGWLTTSYETEDYIMFGEIREFLSLTPKSSFAYFSMRLSNVETHYNRSYTKLQTIIAQVNGIITLAFTVLILILAPYVRLKFYETLINEIFDIKISKGKSKGKNTKKKAAKAAKKQHSKGNDQKDQPQSLEKKPSFNQDLEQQGSKSKPKNEVMNNTPELTDRKDKGDLDLDIKRGSSLEESVQGNNSVLMPVSSIPSPGSESIRKREKLNYSRFRGVFPPNGLTISIQSDTGPINQELSPIESPLDSPDITRREGLMKDRKPSFLQPNFKSLDFEDHGEDFEDMLKNIQQGQQDNKEELVISGIRSENDDQKTLTRTITRGTKNKDTWAPETVRSNNNEEEEEQQMDEKGNEFDTNRKQRLQRIDSTLSKLSGGVNLSFGEYLRSVFSKSDVIKEKMRILNEGINRINERLDIFNLFKKLREFDKLKVLLLEDEQFVLFDSLPRPELTVKSDDTPQNSASQNLIKDAQFIKDKRKKEMILLSYERLKRKTAPTMIDKKLFDIYDNRLSMFLQ